MTKKTEKQYEILRCMLLDLDKILISNNLFSSSEILHVSTPAR